jgi:hypothetical protein
MNSMRSGLAYVQVTKIKSRIGGRFHCRLLDFHPFGGLISPWGTMWSRESLVETIMRERSHPEQGFRAAVGIIRLVKSYGGDRLETACGRRLVAGSIE